MYLEANRIPSRVLDVTSFAKCLPDELLLPDALFPVLGHLCGTLSDGKIPVLTGLQSWKDFITMDHLKAFCAAYGTTGSSPLIHIAGITPEAAADATVQQWVDDASDVGGTIEITAAMLQETYDVLDKDASCSAVDLVALGNPHLSVTECQTMSELIQNWPVCGDTESPLRKHPDIRIIACLSRSIQAQASAAGHLEPLDQFGIEFVNDTCWCMLLDPPVIPASKNATILTNSAKYAHYGPGLTGRRFRFGSMADCIQTAVTGRRSTETKPAWLSARKRLHTTYISNKVLLGVDKGTLLSLTRMLQRYR
jgi:cis-L-3-hydroxyproline dehydratase